MENLKHALWGILLGAIIAFILSGIASAEAQELCSTQMNNRPGDVIETWIDYWDQGDDGFSYMMDINNVPYEQYEGGVAKLWDPANGSCLHQCNPIRFQARTFNVRISTRVTGGNANGWKCAQVTQIVGFVAPQVDIIKLRKKMAAQAYAAFMGESKLWFEVYGLPTCGVALLGGPGGLAAAGVPCFGATLMTFFTDHVKDDQERIALDPDDELYLEGYEPVWPYVESLGIAYTGHQSIDNIIYSLQATIMYADFVYNEGNRAGTCDRRNVDCGWWHRDRVDYGLVQLGAWLDEAALNIERVAWEIEAYYYAPDLAYKLRETVNWTRWAAGEHQS